MIFYGKWVTKIRKTPILYNFHGKIGVKLYVCMYQGPKGTSPGHVIWVTSLNMAEKSILNMQKLCYRCGYVHFSAYECNKMIRVDPRCIFSGTRDQKELVQVM